MIKWADYIAKIEISSLWSGHKHIVWELRPGVNVLSGRNGAGKTTLVKALLGLVPYQGTISTAL